MLPCFGEVFVQKPKLPQMATSVSIYSTRATVLQCEVQVGDWSLWKVSSESHPVSQCKYCTNHRSICVQNEWVRSTSSFFTYWTMMSEIVDLYNKSKLQEKIRGQRMNGRALRFHVWRYRTSCIICFICSCNGGQVFPFTDDPFSPNIRARKTLDGTSDCPPTHVVSVTWNEPPVCLRRSVLDTNLLPGVCFRPVLIANRRSSEKVFRNQDPRLDLYTSEKQG